MLLYDIDKKIKEVMEDIFAYNCGEVVKKTLEIVENVEKNRLFYNTKDEETWKQILYYLTLGLENKDYMVVGDILKYELKPILKIDEIAGGN